MDFPISPLTGSRSAFSKNALQKTWLVASEKNRFQLPLLECLFMLVAGVVGEGDDKTLVRQQLGGHFRSGVHHGGIDEVPVLHSVEQRVSERGFSALAAEGAIGVQQQPALGLTRSRTVWPPLSKPVR